MIFSVPVRGVFETNCYFDIDDQTGHGFLIDPGAEGHRLLRFIREKGWIIDTILLTHGHFDHFGGVEALRNALNVPVMIHTNGRQYLEQPELNLSRFCGDDLTVERADYFTDGDVLRLQEGSLKLQVIHTPGHTLDSVLFYDKSAQVAFVGDTIFRGSMGNPNYPTGNRAQLLQSIRNRVLHLPERTTLCSGHSEPTTVAAEKHDYL